MQDFAQASWSWQFCDTPRLVITFYAMLTEKWNNLCTAVRPCPRTPYARQSGLVHTHSGYTVYYCLSVHCIQALFMHTLCTGVRPRPHTLWLYSVLLFVCALQSGIVHAHPMHGSQASSTYILVYTVYCLSSAHGSQASSTHNLVIQRIAVRLCTAVRPRPHTL